MSHPPSRPSSLPPSPEQSADGALKHAMCSGLAAVAAPGEQAEVDALQDRILAQWSARQPVAHPYRAAVLSQQRPWQFKLGFGLLALVAVIAFQVTQSGRDANIDDLLEPDVLALMAMGEL